MREIKAFSYSCLMIDLPPLLAEEVRGYASTMPKQFLKGNEDAPAGIPSKMHTTVKYGLLTEDAQEVADVIAGTRPFTITLGGASIFHNDTEVVLKLGVESRGLRELNKKVSKELECENTRTNYRMHVTIAYLIKREDDPYYYRAFYSDQFVGREFIVDRVVFSAACGQKSVIRFNGEVTAMNDEMVERIANRTMAAFDEREATLDDLKGGIQFLPRFGISFIIKNDGIYKRGPYGAETFRLIRIRDAKLELQLEDEELKPFLYFTGSYQKLVQELIATGKFHTKRIA